MKFHITIKNNETGELIHDADATAIIGGYTTEEHSMGVILAQCSDLDLARAVQAAELSAGKVRKIKDPLFGFLVSAIANASSEQMTGAEDEENAEEDDEK